MRYAIILLISTLSLGSCQTAAPLETTQTQPATQRPEQLSPQTLARGDCAMFVWERAAPNRFILFTQSRTGAGVWYDGSKSVSVTIDAASGEVEQGQSPQQSLSGADAALDIRLVDAQSITGGTRYSGGRLRVTSAQEWERFIPVVGLSSCNIEP